MQKVSPRGRNIAVLGFPLFGMLGALLLFGATNWVLWRESMEAEEMRVAALAQSLGEHSERIIVDARDMLATFNQSETARCSEAHISAMHSEAIAKPYIRAIGYWRAAQRLCGVGFIQAVELKPTKADRIYDSGLLAWWPSLQTRVGGVQLFLMRFGDHDVAIDPRVLLTPIPAEGSQAGLWVEGLPMAQTDSSLTLPEPVDVPVGLTIDAENDRVMSRFSLGTLFPIDVVVVESTESFWARYTPQLLIATGLSVLFALI